MIYDIATIAIGSVGNEILAHSKRAFDVIGQKYSCEFRFSPCLTGDAANENTTFINNAIDKADKAHAVLIGSADSKFCQSGAVRKIIDSLGVYAYLRHIKSLDKDADIVTVCDADYGVRRNESGFRNGDKFGREAYEIQCYGELEIERVARIAYEIASERAQKLTLADEANVFATSRLWRKIVTDINEDYPDVRLNVAYACDVAARLALEPSSFDVVLAPRAFADVLTSLASAVSGNSRVLPSAYLKDTPQGVYEAVCAPDVFGRFCNPIGAILTSACMLRHSFDMADAADALENAVRQTLSDGCAPIDIGGELSADETAEAVLSRLQ